MVVTENLIFIICSLILTNLGKWKTLSFYIVRHILIINQAKLETAQGALSFRGPIGFRCIMWQH